MGLLAPELRVTRNRYVSPKSAQGGDALSASSS
jgi:hypothetical protein